MKVWRAEAIKDCSPVGLKILPAGVEIFQPTGEQPYSARFQLRASKASLVDGTAINWSVEPAPVKTDINIWLLKKLKEWNYTVPEWRVCDKLTRNEGCLSLSRPVDCNTSEK